MVKKLKIYRNFKVKESHKNSIILIGNFDGLHGNPIFQLAKKYKDKFKTNIGVVTFDPIPKMFFNKKLKNYRISNLEQKINILKKFNVNFIINKKFDRKFSKIKSDNFVKNILYKKLRPRYIFVSNNFRFGNKREGDVKLLKFMSNKHNFKIINPSPLKKKNKTISSTLIRKFLEKGKIKLANNYLSRPWCIEGKFKKEE